MLSVVALSVVRQSARCYARVASIQAGGWHDN